MAKKVLTDRTLKSLKPDPGGRHYDLMDAVVPGLGVRVLSSGRRTFVLVGRFPGSAHPTRRALGEYGALTLDEAREKARTWHELIRAGKDPLAEEAAQRAAEARRREDVFSAVAEAFISEKLSEERKGAEVARDIRRDLVSVLGRRPIAEIRRVDIASIIKAKKKTAPAQARNLLGYAKRLFTWAVNEEVYGLETSPCTDLKARDLIGAKATADRNLSDDELFALWRVAGRLEFPYRQIYQLLILNGLRLNEVVDAADPEFDFRKQEWIIPAARMKGKNGKARPHLVPLTDDSLAIIGKLPTLDKGPFYFSLTFGKSPVWVGSKVKERTDAAMLRTLKALARRRGEDPSTVELPRWTNHDIRRTVRTNLSPLKNAQGQRIPDEVKEAVIAHARPGIKGVYDRYEYLDEKREALELWAARLREITQPVARRSDNVVPLRRA